MVSVIGRRRVGKTFLVESTYQDKIVFKVSGIQDAPRTEQLQNFMLQIDLLIDRNDHVINLFEIKFYRDTFALSKSYNDKLREKAQIFQGSTQTRKQLFWVFISTFGLKNNAHKGSVVAKELTMEDLFIEV